MKLGIGRELIVRMREACGDTGPIRLLGWTHRPPRVNEEKNAATRYNLAKLYATIITNRLLDEDLKRTVWPGGRLKIGASCFESPRNSLKIRGLKK
ncbi:hypothetical protein [Burkholderia reimsis]|uniref:hypothetical protein n=1 Tax=Burkholderia reimsis TaxID=2234132 RepID=UPI001AD7E835|nr:hypothetical protein [Burkholderia reimsis]